MVLSQTVGPVKIPKRFGLFEKQNVSYDFSLSLCNLFTFLFENNSYLTIL